jgi:hypothetical protein
MKNRANLAALCCASVLTMATLKDPNSHLTGRAKVDAEFRTKQRQIAVDIAALGARLDAVDHDGPIYLGLGVRHIYKRDRDLPRWSMEMMGHDGETLILDGGFSFGGEINRDEGGKYGDLLAEIGRLCTSEEDAEDCLPCDIGEGCSLDLDLSICHGRSDELNQIYVAVQDADGEWLEHECIEGEPNENCHMLNDWVAIDSTKGDLDLCE